MGRLLLISVFGFVFSIGNAALVTAFGAYTEFQALLGWVTSALVFTALFASEMERRGE